MKQVLLGMLVMVALVACREAEEAAVAVDAEAGRALAEARCADCHGMDGKGESSGIPNLAAQPAEYLAESLRAYRDGRRHHKALRDLAAEMSEADIGNIAAYYSALPPIEPAAVAQGPAASPWEQGSRTAAICAQCHGENGVSNEPGVPSLAGQQPAYLIASTQQYVRGGRGHAEKKAMLQGLQQLDIEQMAMYFAAQVPPAREAPPFGDPQLGESLSAECGECHGTRGISHDPLVPSLAGQEPLYLVSAIKAYRDHARAHEDMMTDHSDAEIESLAAYYALQRAEAAAGGANDPRELVAKCERCHGPSVGSRKLTVPALAGQDREYLVRVMKAYRDDDRGSSMMHKMSASYSDADIEVIASWYASQPAR